MLITRNNYEEFFLLYVDGELSAGDRIAVEKFAAANPDLLEELNLLKETALIADNEIIFEHKEELYKEEKKKVIGFYWWRVAAAVILLFGAGVWGWKMLDKKEVPAKPIAIITTPVHKADTPKSVITTIPEKKTITPKKINKIITKPEIKQTPTEEITLILPTDLSTTSIEPPKENIVATITPQNLSTENKTPAYEYVDEPGDDIIYVANTSVSKRNKLRGVFRKATRILDRVTSTN